MSHEASTWAFRQDLATGAKFLLVAIANHADKYGVCYPGRASLAKDCSCSLKTVSTHMAQLEQEGLIARRERRRENKSRTSDWIVLAPSAASREPMYDAPPDDIPEPVATLARSGYISSPEDSSREVSGLGQVKKRGGPEPSVEPSDSFLLLEGSGRGREDGSGALPLDDVRRPSREVNRKKVTKDEWRMVEGILASFNAAFGTTFNATERPTVERIVMRVREFPEVSLARHCEIIKRAAIDPWWGTGKPDTVGLVYGPRTFPKAMHAQGNGNARVPKDDFIARINARRPVASSL